jgi:hypothetical protein
MLHLKKPQNHIFIFIGSNVQIQHLPEAHARTHTHTDIHIILQQDELWAENGVCMHV